MEHFYLQSFTFLLLRVLTSNKNETKMMTSNDLFQRLTAWMLRAITILGISSFFILFLISVVSVVFFSK